MIKTKQEIEILPKRDFAKETFGLGFLAFLLSLSISVLPILGVVLSALTPVPLIIIFYFLGVNHGLIVSGIILAAITLIGGMHIGILFIVQYGIMAFIIGESLRLSHSLRKTFLLATVVPLGIGLVLLGLFLSGTDISVISFVEKVINMNVENTIHFYKEMGINEQQIELMQSEAKHLSWILISALPALIIIGSFFSIVVNYFLARAVMIKRYGVTLPSIKSVSLLLIPDIYVWLLIAGGISIFMEFQPLKSIGVNLLIIMLLAYCIQGMGVVSQFSEKWKTPHIVKLFIYIIIFSQPFSLILITGIGLFDIWLDFRKLRVKESQTIN